MVPGKKDAPQALVCPLNWGLGHATRCVPVILELQRAGFQIVLAGNGVSLVLLKKEFPSLEAHTIPGIDVRFGGPSSLAGIRLLPQIPGFLLSIWKERRAIQKIIQKQEIALIISDNRYGAWHKRCTNILITHQLQPCMPPFLGWARGLVKKYLLSLVSRFDEVWIPDLPAPLSLSENLSAGIAHSALEVHFTGLLSRLAEEEKPEGIIQAIQVFVMLSGPEPQRGVLERALLQKFKSGNEQVYLLQGKPAATAIAPDKKEDSGFAQSNIQLFNHLKACELSWYLRHSGILIVRSGYSSLMDLVKLGRTAILIPTPGQAEQEYLARRMYEKGWFFYLPQHQLQQLEFGSGRRVRIAGSAWVFMDKLEARLQQDFPASQLNTGALNKLIRRLWEECHYKEID